MRIKMPERTRTKGQALVEFALAGTLIFFMLAAVVDLGLIFFSLQAIHNAAQEGATYGSRWLKGTTLDEPAIRDRVRHEAGNQGIGFANLLDLNGNGKDDVVFNEQSNGGPLIEDYIQIAALTDVNGDGNPLNDGAAPNFTPCPNVSSSDLPCYIRVVVSNDYNMAFPLAPAFGDKIRLTSSYVMPMRSGFAQGGQPTITPVVVTVTPTP
jgi:Flp pilus assembly protein TadG